MFEFQSNANKRSKRILLRPKLHVDVIIKNILSKANTKDLLVTSEPIQMKENNKKKEVDLTTPKNLSKYNIVFP